MLIYTIQLMFAAKAAPAKHHRPLCQNYYFIEPPDSVKILDYYPLLFTMTALLAEFAINIRGLTAVAALFKLLEATKWASMCFQRQMFPAPLA